MTITKESRKSMYTFMLWNVLGAFIYAVGVICFTVPNNVPPGGFTAIGTMIQSVTGFPVSISSFLLNIPLLLWAARDINRGYAFSTGFVVLLNSVFFEVVTLFANTFHLYYVGDQILAAIFGGLIMGSGIAIGGIAGVGSGGTTTLGILMHRRMPRFPIGQLNTMFNTVIILASIVVYQNINSAMCAIICMFVSGKVIDSISIGLNANLMIFIISKKSAEIRESILEKMHRGTTILRGAGAYDKQDMEILMTVVSKSEFTAIRKIVEDVDDRAFMISSEAGEVKGNGFKHKGF